MSPASRWGSRSAMVLSTTPAGTINHMARGFASFLASSAREDAPTAFSLTISAMAFSDMSKTTQSWPPFNSRRAMLAPMRPRPINPNCMNRSSLESPINSVARRSGDHVRRTSDRPLERAIAADQRVGRAVVIELRLLGALKLRDDSLSQDLAQFHAPLVEGIDLPDRALGEDAVLVEGHELAERRRRQLVQQEGIGRSVALELAMRHEPIGRALLPDLLGGLAERQCFRLGKDVGKQRVVMGTQRVQRPAESDEVAGDEARPLMDQLIERMLAVRPGLAPVDRTGVVVHGDAIDGHMLAVALHGQLLEIGGKALEVLLVGKHGHGLGAEEIIVPEGEQAHEHRQVALQGRGAEMLVHGMEAVQHGREI